MRHSPFTLTQPATVVWLKHEMRAPHVNFYGCRYKGVCLAGLEHQKVTLVFDYRDIRQLQVKKTDGTLVGTVSAPKSWQRFAHGVKTRQYILRLCRQGKLRMKDPLVEYFWLQLQRKNSKKGSLEMLRLNREFNGVVRPHLPEDDDPRPAAPSALREDSASEYLDQTPPSRPPPAWSTDFANAKRNR